MENKTLISLENLIVFKELFAQFITEKLSDKLSEIPEWAKSDLKPQYNATEILLLGNPFELHTKSKEIVGAINEIHEGSAFKFQINDEGILSTANGRTLDISEDGIISIT